ncbi:MAG: hypothetical protein K6E50_14255 [Lachnospiraceae bacterium]|nr:hypothetical protein [Lachnospiraceae bacterium]
MKDENNTEKPEEKNKASENKEPEIIDLDQTGTIKIPEGLPREVSVDTLLLGDMSGEIALNMEDTQLLQTLDSLTENANPDFPQDTDKILLEQTRVIELPEKVKEQLPDDTMPIMDFDETAQIPEMEDLPEGADYGYDLPEGEEGDFPEDYPEDYAGEDPEGQTEENPEDYAGEGAPEEGAPEEVADGTSEDGSDAEDDPDADDAFGTGELIGLSDLEKLVSRGKSARPEVRRGGRRGVIIAAVIAGICLLAAGILIWLGSRGLPAAPKKENPLLAAGQDLSTIGTPGSSGLIAFAAADHGPKDDPTQQAGTDPETDEESVPVLISFTSVSQDLKIKFINKDTERLIRDVIFEVVLTRDGEKIRLRDEDKDGIIYEKEMKGGDYQVAAVDIKGFNFVKVQASVNVRDKIAYQKVDVKEEIKTEAEVNAAVEDTGGSNDKGSDPTPTPASKDTVEWVESSKKPKEGSDGYKKVEKDSIPEPAYARAVMPVPAASRTAAAAADKPAPHPVAAAPGPDAEPLPIDDPTPTPTPVEELTPTPTPKEKEEGTPTPTSGGEKEGTPTPTAAEGEGTPTPTGTGPDPKKDKETKLKDKNGNQLYYKDGDKYVEAVYADYYTRKEFFIVTEIEYVYTGWQTFDGVTYFFDKNGNKVTGDQVIQGVSYHFNSDGSLANSNVGTVKNGEGIMGIDVSKWNGTIDWNAVKAAGVNFAIIRCGYRGSSTGVLVEDPTFRYNIQNAQAAGIKVGLYFFTQAVNEVEAVEEASMCLSLASGYSVSYPIFIDTEFTVGKNGRADGIDRATRTAVCRAFVETIRNGGYAGGVYSSKSWLGPMVDIGSIGGAKVWLAHYTSKTDYAGHYDIWQHSSKGTISGIKGAVDLNWSYMGY